MDELSLLLQAIIDTEVDDLVLDLVYDIHSSLKGIPDEQLEVTPNVVKPRTFLVPVSYAHPSVIEKQTCLCPHCGQSNIIAMRFAYHLAKCLGVGRRSSRQAKHRIVDQVMTIAASSDDSRSNGDEFHNGEGACGQPEDAESCTDSTSSSGNQHRRMMMDDQEYKDEFDHDDEDEDDWKPKKKKRKNPPSQPIKRRKKKDDLLVLPEPISELDFHNCIIPLDKICPRTQHLVIPFLRSNVPIDGEAICLPNASPSLPRSPLNLVEDDPSCATSIILFQEDSKR